MILSGRKKEIFEILYDRGKVSVKELSKTLFVSEMTIRRDISEMEKCGILRRYRGGAILNSEDSAIPISQRFYLGEDEKKLLAKKAVKYLHNDMNIFLDSSSTCQYLIPHFSKFSNISIVTNSVQALLSASKLHIPCFLIGGEYNEADMCLVGSVAESLAKDINVDIAFVSSFGLSKDGVISDTDIKQTMIRKIIINNAKQTVFLFEAYKFDKTYLYTLCRKEDVTEVILP